MRLNSLKLIEFRNYHQYQINLQAGINILVGNNAVGKSNVLEAIYLLATGEGYKAGKIEEMIEWHSEVAHVIGEVSGKPLPTSGENEFQLRVTLTKGMVSGKRVKKRIFLVNGVSRVKDKMVGLLPAVLFSPDDMGLLSGNPGLRRQFLDEVLMQTEPEYVRSMVSYDKALKRRNKLLDLIREGKMRRTALTFWDQIVIKDGNVITRFREKLVDKINATAALSGEYELVYDRSTISEARLEQYQREEEILGYTLVGPHKDDFWVILKNQDGKNLGKFGSRGEQRMAVLWLKEAELNYMEERLKERPVLLLDDVLSELDDQHEEQVMVLTQKQQTIITTTEEEAVSMFGKQASVIRLRENEE